MAFPELVINRKIASIDDFEMKDFEIIGYSPGDTIKAPMAV